MDTILIQELSVSYCVGVTDAERSAPQTLSLTIEMSRDLSAAAACDRLEETVDYYAVCQRLRSFGGGRSWKLIESLASEIAQMILAEFKASRVTVEVRKFIIPETRYVAVRLTRP